MGTHPSSKIWLKQRRACGYVTLAVGSACASMLGVHSAHKVSALQTWSTDRDAHVRRCKDTRLSVTCKGADLQYTDLCILELSNIVVFIGLVKSFKLDRVMIQATGVQHADSQRAATARMH